jgi:hypothetical protein
MRITSEGTALADSSILAVNVKFDALALSHLPSAVDGFPLGLEGPAGPFGAGAPNAPLPSAGDDVLILGHSDSPQSKRDHYIVASRDFAQTAIGARETFMTRLLPLMQHCWAENQPRATPHSASTKEA